MIMQPDDSPEQPPTQEFTIDEAARIMGRSPATIRRMITRGQLQATKAATTTGFVYRIRLKESDYAGEGPTQGFQALEAFVEAYRAEMRRLEEAMRTLVEENARQSDRLESQAEEIGRLKEVERALAAEQAQLTSAAMAIERENARLRDVEATLRAENDRLLRRSLWSRLLNR